MTYCCYFCINVVLSYLIWRARGKLGRDILNEEAKSYWRFCCGSDRIVSWITSIDRLLIRRSSSALAKFSIRRNSFYFAPWSPRKCHAACFWWSNAYVLNKFKQNNTRVFRSARKTSYSQKEWGKRWMLIARAFRRLLTSRSERSFPSWWGATSRWRGVNSRKRNSLSSRYSQLLIMYGVRRLRIDLGGNLLDSGNRA